MLRQGVEDRGSPISVPVAVSEEKARKSREIKERKIRVLALYEIVDVLKGPKPRNN